MNTLFTYLNNIIHYKKVDKSVESDSTYNQYMINRWVSMYSPQAATIVNHTVNTYWSILGSKYDHNKFITNVIPRSKIYRINYIKKSKKDKKDNTSEIITYLAQRLELSEREIRYYIESQNIDLTNYNHLCKKNH